MTASDAFVAVGSENGYIYVLNRKDGSIYFKYYFLVVPYLRGIDTKCSNKKIVV